MDESNKIQEKTQDNRQKNAPETSSADPSETKSDDTQKATPADPSETKSDDTQKTTLAAASITDKLKLAHYAIAFALIVLVVALISGFAAKTIVNRQRGTVNGGNAYETAAGMTGSGAFGDAAGSGTGGNTTDSSSGGSHTDGTASVTDGDFTLVCSSGNSWTNGDIQMCSADLQLTNHSASAVSDWSLVLKIDGLQTVEGWNAVYSVHGDYLTISGMDHTKEIAAGATVSLGCNIGTAGSLSVASASLNNTACTITGNATAGNTADNQNNTNPQNNNSQGSHTGSQNNSANNNPSNNGTQANNQNNNASNPPAPAPKGSAKQGDDWLHTDGNRILDKDSKQVWLTGVNWFGYNTGTNTFDGLWNSRLEPTVKGIADHGFNLIRVPISAELINQWASGEYPRANYNNAYNEKLNSMNSLEIFDYFLELAAENGIKVMPDIHSAETNASGHNVNLWCTDRISVNDYYSALEWMAERYKDNDTIIAFDLKNEPHGKPHEGNNAAIWNDSKASNNWKYVAETAASKVLAKNPNVLILVEGTEIYPIKKGGDYSSADADDYYFNWWGGNLRAVADYPIDLGKHQDKLVYSPHDYGPTVYQQPWFEGNYTYDSLMKDCWYDNWLYIHDKKIAPLLIGEWGGFMREPNLTWMTYMRQLIATYHLNHTFWCLNANSGDTGGLLLDDFTTWDNEKYNFVKEVLWQENGKFVGLDHEIPLGVNGITLKDAKGLK